MQTQAKKTDFHGVLQMALETARIEADSREKELETKLAEARSKVSAASVANTSSEEKLNLAAEHMRETMAKRRQKLEATRLALEGELQSPNKSRKMESELRSPDSACGKSRMLQAEKTIESILQSVGISEESRAEVSAPSPILDENPTCLDSDIKDDTEDKQYAREAVPDKDVNQAIEDLTARLEALERFAEGSVPGALGKLTTQNRQVAHFLEDKLESAQAETQKWLKRLDDTVANLNQALESAKTTWQDESKQLWEAVDSHTHDLNVDDADSCEELQTMPAAVFRGRPTTDCSDTQDRESNHTRVSNDSTRDVSQHIASVTAEGGSVTCREGEGADFWIGPPLPDEFQTYCGRAGDAASSVCPDTPCSSNAESSRRQDGCKDGRLQQWVSQTSRLDEANVAKKGIERLHQASTGDLQAPSSSMVQERVAIFNKTMVQSPETVLRTAVRGTSPSLQTRQVYDRFTPLPFPSPAPRAGNASPQVAPGACSPQSAPGGSGVARPGSKSPAFPAPMLQARPTLFPGTVSPPLSTPDMRCFRGMVASPAGVLTAHPGASIQLAVASPMANAAGSLTVAVPSPKAASPSSTTPIHPGMRIVNSPPGPRAQPAQAHSPAMQSRSIPSPMMGHRCTLGAIGSPVATSRAVRQNSGASTNVPPKSPTKQQQAWGSGRRTLG